MRIGSYSAAVLARATLAAAQELPRHAVLPVAVDGLSCQAGNQQRGVVVKEVTAGAPSRPPEIQVGDVITEIADNTISAPSDIPSVLHRLRAGQTVAIKLQRRTRTVQTAITLPPAPYESLPGIDVLYRAVNVEGFLRRVIITKPKSAWRFLEY